MRLVLASAVCVALLFGGAAFAQDKKGKIPERTQKVLVDNDRVRVTETVYPPGGGTNVAGAPAYRITRALKGGTLERTYADGRKETAAFKTGEVKEQPAAKAPYTLKNTGKSDVVLYTVQIKK
jgi:hypothetical protein